MVAICVSVGSAVPAAQEEIAALERALGAAAPDMEWKRAFTSRRARQMLARQGQPTLSLQEALAGAAGQPVAVQPLLLLPGRAYEEIKSEVQAQRHCFPQIRLGKPLVSAREDLRALAAALNRAYPAVAGETLVLVGHGTDHEAGAAYVRLQAMFHAGGRGDIRVVTLKERLEKKALFSELKAVAPAVHLVPLLLAAGKHVQTDIAGKGPESWAGRLQGEGLSVRCTRRGLGTLPEIQNLFVQHFRSMR